MYSSTLISTLLIIYGTSFCLFYEAKGLQNTKPILRINSDHHHHSSCPMFFSRIACHFIIICGCKKVSNVEEALPQPCSQAGGSATLWWALIEPADLTFVSLTLWGASAPCLDHNTISTSEPLTSAAWRSHREAKRRWAESLFAFQLQLHDFLFLLSLPNTARGRHKSVFCSYNFMDWVRVTF